MNLFFSAAMLVVALAGAFALVGCSHRQPQPATLTLATTTSTQDSGLLDDLLPAFKQQTGVQVKVIAVGSGQALELGRRGDADVLLTHSPAAERAFMEDGFGNERRGVMHNDFVIAGPTADPAKIKQHAMAAEAFRAIMKSKSPFVSRGDESGTHQKEVAVWKDAGIQPSSDWYIQAGSGMAQALRIADEKLAYVLTDRATFLALKRELDIAILLEGDPQLLNHYSVITISKAKHPHVHESEANSFAEFLTSAAGQDRIAAFGVDKYGEPLFVPDAQP